jgi:hypothetical protein
MPDQNDVEKVERNMGDLKRSTKRSRPVIQNAMSIT